MTRDEFNRFSEDSKKELQKLYDQKVFNSLIEIIDCTFRNSNILDETFEFHLYSMHVMQDDTRKMIPLCCIGPSKGLDGKYSGVAFGIIPKLSSNIELKLEVIKK